MIRRSRLAGWSRKRHITLRCDIGGTGTAGHEGCPGFITCAPMLDFGSLDQTRHLCADNPDGKHQRCRCRCHRQPASAR